MRYQAIVLLMSALMFSVTLAQTEEEIPPYPLDETTPEEEVTLPEEEVTLPEEEVTLPEEEVSQPEEEVSQPDVNESSEPVTQYVYYEDTSDLIPDNPTAVLEEFFQALKSGDSETVAFLISNEALDNIDIMLEILKESLDRDEELTMNRLIAAGYTATASEIDDWSALEYLTFTISLPIMSARYSLYEMQIGEYIINGNDIDIPLVFISSTGIELPFEVKLIREDDSWKVLTFMGFNSFP